jgi:hypothetical protein
VLLLAWRVLDNVAIVEEVEALACMEGMRLATDWLRQPTMVESDCLGLIKEIRSGEDSRASWVGSIAEIKALSQLLLECSFRHVRRDANQVAHELARLAMRRKQSRVKCFSFPPEISRVVQKDGQNYVMSGLGCNPSTLI